MEDLVKAAQDEGTLNVIALPPTWANYGTIIETFSEKYDIKVQSDQPDAASQDEINAANQLKGTDRAPDVFDLGQSVALANTDLYAPYKVSPWDDVPAEFKDPDGAWISDYGGYMSVGYDSSKVPDVTSLDDLLGPEFKGKVALNETDEAGAAFSGVVMASVANGGSADDIAPGVDYFREDERRRQPAAGRPDLGHDRVRTDPRCHRLGLLQRGRVGQAAQLEGLRPGGGPIASYLLPGDQRRRPAPRGRAALAEFLYGDEGQNLWLTGGAHPRRRHGRGRRHRPSCTTPSRRSRARRSSRPTSRPRRWPPTWRTTGRSRQRPPPHRSRPPPPPRRPHRRAAPQRRPVGRALSATSRSSCCSPPRSPWWSARSRR